MATASCHRLRKQNGSERFHCRPLTEYECLLYPQDMHIGKGNVCESTCNSLACVELHASEDESVNVDRLLVCLVGT